MGEFILKKIIQPGLAILFCLAFGVPFVYTGFQSVEISGTKHLDGQVSMDINRSHFAGLYTVHSHVEDVEGATRSYSRVPQPRSRFLRSTRQTLTGVFLDGKPEGVRVIAGSSNVNDRLKLEIVDSINAFVRSDDRTSYFEVFRVTNIFGWFGLPFLIIGILGLLGWPFSLFRE
jgi:hypothetical protein